MKDELEATVEVVRKLRRLLEKTTDALPPANPSALSADEMAQRRWQIHLGVLMHDAARSIEKLAKANELRGCIILSRCLYEYRIRSAYYMKHPDIALKLYRSARSRHYWDLQRLPPLDVATEIEMANDYLQWYKTSDASDENLGLPGVVAMAVDLAEPNDVLTDPKGKKYVHEEATSYTIPSWFVHGGPQLIVDLFDDWEDPANWRIHRETRMVLFVTIVRAAIEHLVAFLIAVRHEFGMDETRVRQLFTEAFKLAGFDKKSK
jgi:hypothetical protein